MKTIFLFSLILFISVCLTGCQDYSYAKSVLSKVTNKHEEQKAFKKINKTGLSFTVHNKAGVAFSVIAAPVAVKSALGAMSAILTRVLL